jgi:MFS transporter, ACS family, D-galactonate transporter
MDFGREVLNRIPRPRPAKEGIIRGRFLDHSGVLVLAPSSPASREAAAAAAHEVRRVTERVWLIALLVTAMIFCYAQRGTLSIAAPFLIQDLGISRTTMGVMLSAFSWCYAFMQVPAGWLVDRFGVRRAYAFGFALWSGACALTGAIPHVAAILAFRILVGVGQSVAFPASARAVANWFQVRQRGTIIGGYLTGVRLGQALINVVGVWLIIRYGWRIFFVIAGLIPLVWLVPWLRILKRWEQATPQSTTPELPGSRSFAFATSFGLLRHRSVLGTFLGYVGYDYVWFVYVYWLPGYLVLERGFTPAEMSFYASVPFLIMSVVIVLSGVTSDRLVARGLNEVRVRQVFLTVGLGVACCIVPAGLVADNDTAVTLLVISLCGIGIASPNTWAITQAVCSKRLVGTVSGIQNFGGNLGGIVAPLATGLIADLTGSFALALAICGVMLVGSALAYWLLVNERVEADLAG